MPKTRSPRKSSLQFWPRVRAKRMYARLRNLPESKEAKPQSFAGYKVGMTHIVIVDNRQHTPTKGEEIVLPVTILECPPIKVASIRAYKLSPQGLVVATEVLHSTDKNLGRKIVLPKKPQEQKIGDMEKNISSYSQIRLNVYTQPHLTGISKKTPEYFEVGIGGSIDDQLKFAKEKLGKEIRLSDVIKEGQQVDTFAVTKGKGFQGPVKRHGVSLRQHKSEKSIRGPANVGSWTGNRSWTVAHAGQMGFHQRMERNKWVLKISDKPEEFKIAGGFIRYGHPNSTILLLKGSIQGAKKRLVRFSLSTRAAKNIPHQSPSIELISQSSQQGN
ncbi:MAG: 50S ribosomal protein L3 [Nanoarchaeota archaeon]